MAPSNVFLYRTLLRSCKELFLPENIVFLQSALDCISEEVRTLPYGTEFERRLPANPRNELKKAFTQGSATDVNVLWSVLPTVLRFSRAAKLIAEQFPRQVKEQSQWSMKRPKVYPPKDDSSMLPGAILISKLYYTTTELKERNVDEIIEQGVKVLAKILQEEFDRESAALTKRLAPFQTSELQSASYEDQQRLRVLPMIRALHETILRAEANRIRVPGEYEQLVDRILRPERPYDRGFPITYSVLYSAVLRSLGRSIQGLGISYPRDFRLRIVAKWRQSDNTVVSMAPQNIGIRSHRRHKREDHLLDEVNFLELKGRWVGHIGDTMQEAVISYDSSTRTLQATKVDGDKFLPAGEVFWKIDLARICKTSNLLMAGIPYECEVQAAAGSYVPYLLTIHTLPASIFLPQFAVHGMYSASPYYEIVLEPALISTGGRGDLVGTGQPTYPDSEANSTSVSMKVATGGAALSQESHPRANMTTITRTHTGSATHPSLSTHHPSEDTGATHSDARHQPSSSSTTSPSYSRPKTSSAGRGAVRGVDPQQAVRLAPRSQEAHPSMLQRAADTASAVYDSIKHGTPTPTNTTSTNRSDVASSANAVSVTVVVSPTDSVGYPTTQGADWQPQVLRFCRTLDLDRCLLEVSDLGVKVVTPCAYQQELRDYAYPTDDFPSLLNPATAYKVAQRMANNLTHSSMREGREEDALFWKAVAKLFEYRLKQADRY